MKNSNLPVWILFLLSALGHSGCLMDPGGQQQQAEAIQSVPGGLVRFRTVQIMDDHGWEQPVPAGSVLLPAGWQARGGMQWNSQSVCLSQMVSRHLQAVSPDGRIGFEMLPAARWEWGREQLVQAEIQLRGCQVAAPLDAAGALRDYVVPRFRPGALIRDVRPSRDLAEGAQQELYRVWGPALQMQSSTLAATAVRAVLEYSLNGQPCQEWLVLAVTEVVTPSINGAHFNYSVDHIYAFRAPSGELEKYGPLFDAIVSSVRTNPAWETALVQLVASLNSGISRYAGARASIWRNAMDQVGQIRMNTWQQSQESLNRVSVSWSRTTRGVDGYLDPTTQQTVELPTGYRNAWSNGQGEYILTPDPSYNPNSAFRARTWHRMPTVEQ